LRAPEAGTPWPVRCITPISTLQIPVSRTYYDGKLVIYDWMRNWLMAVTLDSAGNFYRLEPFADSVRMSRPMDMFFSKNGSLWLIEYGTRWYSANEDARPSRIDYVRGPRTPRAGLKANRTEAGAPAAICLQFQRYNGTRWLASSVANWISATEKRAHSVTP
jgi:hypothetical protein